MSRKLIQGNEPSHARRQFLTNGIVALGGSVLAWPALAAAGANHAEHHHHHAATPAGDVKRSEVQYKLPKLKMLRNDGTTALFPQEIDDGRMVMLNFIFTSCTAVCPVTSQAFSQAQGLLFKDLPKLHMMSISIDPEYDTPSRLAEYAKRFRAGAQWQHYTGTVESSIALQKAFDAYRGDKMNHAPLTFLRAAPGKPWVRLDGFASPEHLAHELRMLAG